MVTLIDISISPRPWKFHHIWVTLLYLIGYLIFQVFYIVVFDGTDMYDNDYVYPILKWKSDPVNATIVAFGVILSAVLAHTILWLFASIRDKPREESYVKLYDKVAIKDVPEDESYNINNDNMLYLYIHYILYINGDYAYMLSYMVYLLLYMLYIYTLTSIYKLCQMQDNAETDNGINCLA